MMDCLCAFSGRGWSAFVECVGMFGSTILYHTIKYNAEWCTMVETSRRHRYWRVDSQHHQSRLDTS